MNHVASSPPSSSEELDQLTPKRTPSTSPLSSNHNNGFDTRETCIDVFLGGGDDRKAIVANQSNQINLP